MKKNELVSTDEFNNLPASSKGCVLNWYSIVV